MTRISFQGLAPIASTITLVGMIALALLLILLLILIMDFLGSLGLSFLGLRCLGHRVVFVFSGLIFHLRRGRGVG